MLFFINSLAIKNESVRKYLHVAESIWSSNYQISDFISQRAKYDIYIITTKARIGQKFTTIFVRKERIPQVIFCDVIANFGWNVRGKIFH